MTEHAVGGITGVRQGCFPVIHSFIIKNRENGAQTIDLLTIDGTTKEPKCFRIFAQVLVAYDNTNATTLSIGRTGTGYTDVINAVDAKATVGTTYAGSTTNAFEYTEAKTPIKAVVTVGDTDVTVGAILVCIEVWGVNTTLIPDSAVS